ncbi:MAG: hypothetical protein JJT96_09700 [Opitutales bacterium]|nr:hypothetical protein [Opitutales bacterium]
MPNEPNLPFSTDTWLIDRNNPVQRRQSTSPHSPSNMKGDLFSLLEQLGGGERPYVSFAAVRSALDGSPLAGKPALLRDYLSPPSLVGGDTKPIIGEN